jgi:hypothetical protein
MRLSTTTRAMQPSITEMVMTVARTREDPREGAAEQQHRAEQERQAAEGAVVALARGRLDVERLDAGREGERAGVDDRLGGEAELGEEHEAEADEHEVDGDAEHRAHPRGGRSPTRRWRQAMCQCRR